MDWLQGISKWTERIDVINSAIRIIPKSGKQDEADHYALEHNEQLLAAISALCGIKVFRYLSHSCQVCTDRTQDSVTWKLERIGTLGDYWAGFNAELKYSRGLKKGKRFDNPRQFNCGARSMLMRVWAQLGGNQKVVPSDLYRKLNWLKSIWFQADLRTDPSTGEQDNKLINESIRLINISYELIVSADAKNGAKYGFKPSAVGVEFGFSQGLDGVENGFGFRVLPSSTAHADKGPQADSTACDSECSSRLTVQRLKGSVSPQVQPEDIDPQSIPELWVTVEGKRIRLANLEASHYWDERECTVYWSKVMGLSEPPKTKGQ